jgi:GntR family transcriptional regulator
MEIDHDSPTPVYQQIAGWVARQIESGALQPGRPIPSEKMLMQEAEGVARTTVRRAVAYLRDQDLIYTVPHRGSYVTRPDQRPPEPSQ